MNQKRVWVVLCLLISCRLLAFPIRAATKLAHTYSIVARDPETGQLGVAVQSHWFSVGSLVVWAEAGVGAVATQSFVEPSYGPLGLELMRAGKTSQQALEALLVADSNKDVRQVAMIDAKGNVSVHTGDKCIPEAGHITGRNFSVQANLMLSEDVWPNMAKAFRSSSGSLAERMLSALEAAEAAGGDIRGRQSAAILVVEGTSAGPAWQGRVVDLRVEDNPHPLKELRRLLTLHKAYDHMNRGDLAVEQNDSDTAMAEYGAAEEMFPDNLEMKFWHAVSLVNMGRTEEALPLFQTIFAADSNWATLLTRLPSVELLPVDQGVMDRLLSVAPEGWQQK